MGLYRRGKSKTWYIHYENDGRRYREAIGPSKRQAELVLAKRRTDLREGRFFDLPSSSSGVTFRELSDRYQRDHAIPYKSPTTIEGDRSRWNALVHEFGARPLSRIKAADVSAFLAARRRGGAGPATVNRYRALLSHVLSMAVRWRLLAWNPVRDVRPLPGETRRVRFLEQAELDRLLDACPPWLRRLVTVAVHTGMRRGELMGLRWEQVDLERGQIALTKTKNRQARALPVTDACQRALLTAPRRAGCAFVFADELGHPLSPWGLRNAWDAVVKETRLKNFRFHDLRHTFASHLVMAGVDLPTVRELMGHKTLDMTIRYAHLAPAHARRAIRALERKLPVAPPVVVPRRKGGQPGASQDAPVRKIAPRKRMDRTKH